MWITGFDVPCLTYLYNDKPLKKHLLIQTISRVNRKYPGKEYGMVIDYIGIRDNMREAMKLYGGNTSVAPTSDDVEQATSVFREELEVLKNMFTGYDLTPFINMECNPIDRYRLLAKAAEYVFVSIQELQSEGKKGPQTVSFKTYFLKTVKRMRMAFDICQPSGYLGEEESALAQCFMAIAGFVRKMSGTSEVDTDSMNRAVSKMVEEALKYNQVESVLESGEEEDIFSPEYFEKLSDVKMPATKLELLVKMLRKQIKEYGKVNRLAGEIEKIKGQSNLINYLGFTFDGRIVHIRDKSLFKFYCRAYRKIKRIKENTDEKSFNAGKKAIYHSYTHLGASKYSKDHGNFLTYAYKADEIFSQSKVLESGIRNQVKRHWYKIDSKLKE